MSKDNKSKCRKSSKKVTVENTGKNLTSQSGLIPVIGFMKKNGFSKLFYQSVKHQRAENAVYELSEIVELVILGIIAGACSISKVLTVWSDKVLQRIGGWFRIPDETTLGRIFKTVKERHIVELEGLNHRIRGRIWKQARGAGQFTQKELKNHWIDGDSTVITVYGNQEGAEKGYNPHKKGAKSYHPLLAFSAHTKEILQGILRCGSAYTSNGIVEFMKQLCASLPSTMRIVFRADSGFFWGELLKFLEALSYGYLVKVKMKGLEGLLETQKWTRVIGQGDWEQCEFFYACKDWNRPRRFVGVRREIEEKPSRQLKLSAEIKTYDYFCYVVSEPLTPWETHKRYGERATCENWIEESKNQMALTKIRTDSFLANAALFQCAILAYNTVRWMALRSKDALLRTWEVETIRTFLIRVAGKLKIGGNQQRLKTPESHLYLSQWEAWVGVGLT